MASPAITTSYPSNTWIGFEMGLTAGLSFGATVVGSALGKSTFTKGLYGAVAGALPGLGFLYNKRSQFVPKSAEWNKANTDFQYALLESVIGVGIGFACSNSLIWGVVLNACLSGGIELVKDRSVAGAGTAFATSLVFGGCMAGIAHRVRLNSVKGIPPKNLKADSPDQIFVPSQSYARAVAIPPHQYAAVWQRGMGSRLAADAIGVWVTDPRHKTPIPDSDGWFASVIEDLPVSRDARVPCHPTAIVRASPGFKQINFDVDHSLRIFSDSMDELVRRIEKARVAGKNVRLFLGCGENAHEVVEAAQRFPGDLIVGIDLKGPNLMAPKEMYWADLLLVKGNIDEAIDAIKKIGKPCLTEVYCVAPPADLSSVRIGINRRTLESLGLDAEIEIKRRLLDHPKFKLLAQLQGLLRPGGRYVCETHDPLTAAQHARDCFDYFDDSVLKVIVHPPFRLDDDVGHQWTQSFAAVSHYLYDKSYLFRVIGTKNEVSWKMHLASVENCHPSWLASICTNYWQKILGQNFAIDEEDGLRPVIRSFMACFDTRTSRPISNEFAPIEERLVALNALADHASRLRAHFPDDLEWQNPAREEGLQALMLHHINTADHILVSVAADGQEVMRGWGRDQQISFINARHQLLLAKAHALRLHNEIWDGNSVLQHISERFLARRDALMAELTEMAREFDLPMPLFP